MNGAMGTISAILSEFARDVRVGLGDGGRKRLPAKYLYDALGSALFEAITELPEYGLTRADERLLKELSAELPGFVDSTAIVAELGSGSGTKTRHVLEAFGGDLAYYYPIDVSEGALRRCRQELGDVADVRGFHGAYLDGIQALERERPMGVPICLLFLGSSIGNFNLDEAERFLRRLRALLRAGDCLLLGADLIKPIDTLIEAYDDPTGVTAALNLNVLGRMNRELDANFNLRAFEHEARFDFNKSRVEMHLRSTVDQTVDIRLSELTCTFRKDETIHTESSYKFELGRLRSMVRRTGFDSLAEWVDDEWPFVETFWRIEESVT